MVFPRVLTFGVDARSGGIAAPEFTGGVAKPVSALGETDTAAAPAFTGAMFRAGDGDAGLVEASGSTLAWMWTDA
jgi:hypothetical protein